MKKIIAATILVLALTAPVCAQDYNWYIYPVSLTCKIYWNGGYLQTANSTYFALDIYGYMTGYDTGDQFVGYLIDSGGNTWYEFYGQIVWNASFSSGYIQGTTVLLDDGITTFYLDGTFKRSGSKYALTARGGESDSWMWEGEPYVWTCSSIKGSGYVEYY